MKSTLTISSNSDSDSSSIGQAAAFVDVQE